MSDVEATCAKLRSVTVATLTTVLFKRGFRNQFLADVGPLNAEAASMAGPAYTVRTVPAREDKATPEILGDRAYPQRAAIEACPAGHVLVVDSRQDARAASGGDILMARLQARGVAGCVTDGGMRDCPAIADLGFPVYQAKPSPPISLLHHIAVDMNVPVACGGVGVWPGDIIVGDREGVIVVPADIAPAVADEAVAMMEYEDFVLDEVKAGASIFGLYPRNANAEPKFEAWKSKRAQ
ncbi:MAG: ribonuclease activity regulator RraA [Pseudomonadota bacterium]